MATTEQRRTMLRALLVASYSAVPFDELPRATPAMVRTWFTRYPIDGHTMRKALSFFVNAARDAGLPMSNAVGKMARAKAPGKAGASGREKGMAPRAARAQAPSGWPHLTAAVHSQGDIPAQGFQTTERTVALESGGSVTLTLAVDLFGLSEHDREFVLKLVDLTRDYGDRQGAPEQTARDGGQG